MKILAWNIQQGGGGRVPGICRAIHEHDPDVAVLSEYQRLSGAGIRSSLWLSQWPNFHEAPSAPHENGLCVLAKREMRATPGPGVPRQCGSRWLDIHVAGSDITVTGIHIPNPGDSGLDRVSKRAFWDAVLEVAAERRNVRAVFVGDFNTGRHGADGTGAQPLPCEAQFRELTALGWIDAWRHFHGCAFEATWVHQAGNGIAGQPFRLDHAFISPALLPRLKSCYYSHAEREVRLSDHSVAILEVD